MTIKKKERVLTKTEFQAKQKRDYAPFWINSEVLFGANLFPVHESFTNQITILFLVDVADFSTERASELLQYWKIKYDKLRWEAVFVFQQKYAFLKNQKFFDRFKNKTIFIDTFGELFERFGSQKEPVAVVLKNGELLTSLPLLPNFSEAMYQLEVQLHHSLRLDDAGLPLFNPEKINNKSIALDQRTLGVEEINPTGEWEGSKTLLVTEKNGSAITIAFRGKFLRLIGMAHPNSRDPIKVSVTFNDKSLSPTLKTPVIYDDVAGGTMVELNKYSGIYDLIHSESEVAGIIKLTFLNATDNGAVFYEFKIA